MLKVDKPQPAPVGWALDSRCHLQHRWQWALCVLLATATVQFRNQFQAPDKELLCLVTLPSEGP